MIYILTGAINTGKTTALLDWSKTRNDVDGLLSPDNEAGKRYFLKIKAKIEFALELELEVETEGLELVAIGNFKFLKSAFIKANDFLISIASETKNKYLIIDEIGKLELKNEGLHRAAEKIIPEYEFNKSEHLILVVRDYLLEDVLVQYDISQYLILKKEDLEKL
jgi:nucleoside-triphosphatase THEP1